jgi:hypothetical protein
MPHPSQLFEVMLICKITERLHDRELNVFQDHSSQ